MAAVWITSSGTCIRDFSLLAADLEACDVYGNGVAAAQRTSAPTQVIAAGKDRMIPGKATKKLIEHLSNPEVTFIQDCGHMVPIEAPDQCRRLLEDFILSNNPAGMRELRSD